MADARKVSIIVLTHNQLDFTKQCFQKLFDTTNSYELLIIDNASTDGTIEYLQELEAQHKQVRVILNPQNRGFSAGCNQGVAEARYELVCLLNNDTLPFPGWLDALRKDMHKGVGIVGSRLLFPDNTLQHAGIEFHYMGDAPQPYFGAGHRWFGQPANLPEANVREEVAGVTGACLLTTRRIWNEVGGLDEGYIMANYEDVDYNLKVRAAGYSVIYEPKSTLVHFMNTTINSKKGHPDDPLQFHNHNLARLNEKWFFSLANGLAWTGTPAA